ncbi:MAG: hypothetical protein J6R99_02895 [Alphaproteobacteria bacterium]|nr:hypothetical protein [Alphaproteobacteria bacterium]MBO7066576.1 hypothetical protein [Alphaproteobacteria bacterium]
MNDLEKQFFAGSDDLEAQFFAEKPKQKRGVVNGTLQSIINGATYNLADESAAAGRAITDKILQEKPSFAPAMGGNMGVALVNQNPINSYSASINDKYNEYLPEERAAQKEFDKKHPVLSVGGRIAGAIANPANRLIPAANGTLLGSKLLADVGMGALQGGVYGGLYGLGEGEGGLENRLNEAYRQAKTGAIIGGAIPVAKEGIKAAGRLVADVAGTTSGAGGESLKRGFDAGTRNSETYKNAMRGKGSVYDVVDDVDKAVRAMEKNASAKYKAMLPDNGKTLKLPDKEFNEALKKASDSISGVTSGVDDTAAKAVNKAYKLADNIKLNGGLTFDNALEAKKAMDGIIEPLSRAGEKNAVRILTPIRNALNNTLESAVPEYGGARAAFRADTRLIENIKHALTSSDPTTELRKLQGITRQSVAAAQGGKQELGAVLDAVSNKKILDAVAGGQVQQWVPRDPVRALAAGGAALSTRALSANPFGIVSLSAFSPRVLGETSFLLGRAANALPKTNTSAVLQLVEALKKR